MRTPRRVTTLTATLVAAVATVVVAQSPVRASGPSVSLPSTPSVPVTQDSMGGVGQDDAGHDSAHGDRSAPAGTVAGSGDTSATPLKPSATWTVSSNTGDFRWNYPLRVPPAPGGSEPSLALEYSSGSVDGATAATNYQSSWIGDGWNLEPGFIERGYGLCMADKEGDVKPPVVGDLCWRSDNATASFNGTGGVLIAETQGDTNTWRLEQDDGSRVQRLVGGGNGDNNGEYWKITTVDGTQYFFGSRPESSSTWTVPVFGDDSGEPCHAAAFEASSCTQAWRWNLDKVIDPHGNMTLYGYDTETNSYGFDLKDAAKSYVRDGTLRTIEYGLRADDSSVPAAGKVDFATADRCVPGSDCTPSKPDNWPDVPWSQNCDTATCHGKYVPSFWSTKRLDTITTSVRDGDSYSPVDQWKLNQEFPNPGNVSTGKPGTGERGTLWLHSIVHTGLAGGSTALPAVTFSGVKLANRVQKVDGMSWMMRYRLGGIVSETGGLTSIHYADPDCTQASIPANPQTNTQRCFPVTWTPPGGTERTDWFHKYVVESVTTSDRLSTGKEATTRYEYLGGAAWHFGRAEQVPPDKRTWDEYRGYAVTRVRTGSPDDPGRSPVSLTEYRYYRGMNGDKLPDNGTRPVSVTDAAGGSHPDDDWLRGFPLGQTAYDGDGGPVVSRTVTTPDVRGPSASRGDYHSYLVRNGTSTTDTALAAGGWRTTRTTTSYDDRGLATMVDDRGDVATGADDLCTRTTYARNTDAWLLNLPAETQTVSVGCDTTGWTHDKVVSDTVDGYDGKPLKQAPDHGDPTEVDSLASWPSSGRVYVTTRAGFDRFGRQVSATDARGRTATTGYTPDGGGPATRIVVTDPAGFVTTSTLVPGTGRPLTVTDANGRLTEYAYDPLGRLVETWLPDRLRAANVTGNVRYSYATRNDAPSAITTKQINARGNYTTSVQIYDGWGRLRQVQAPAEGGGRLLTDTRYDSHGRPYKTTGVYFNDAPVDDKLWVAADVDIPQVTWTKYDGVGRPVLVSVHPGADPELWHTATRYDGDRVHVTPPAGGTPTTTINDSRGRTVEVRRYQGGTAPGDSYDSTSYTYTPAGQQATMTDPAGKVWRNTYDLLGRQVRNDSPDTGTTTMTYDPAGDLLSRTDARGATLAYDYDDLGRRTAEHDGTATGPVLARWTYDTVPNGKGRPATATRYVGATPYTTAVTRYSAKYQVNETQVTIPEAEQTLADTYTTRYQYNPDGSLAAAVLPPLGDLPKETVTYSYDDLGLPTTVTGAPDGQATVYYATAASYTRYGELQQLQLGRDGGRVWLTSLRNANTRRLERTVVDAEVPHPQLSDTTYTQNPIGDITSMAEQAPDGADRQCLTYDHLRRLTEAWTPAAASCAGPPTTPALGGPAPYWQSLTYDPVGDRRTDTRHTPGGDVQHTYATAPTGHELQSISTTDPSGVPAGTDTFGYDATGHTVSRTVSGASQSLTWDQEGRLAKVSAGGADSTYVYAVGGDRLLRRDPTGTTLYLPGQEVHLDPATGAKTATRYYAHAGTTIAVRTAKGLTWLAPDHQGTPRIAISATDLAVARRRQTPFGDPRGPLVTFPGEKGFVGGTTDASTGLTHLGARDYDPATGRFLSVDPVLDSGDPQEMNGYAYSDDSPVSNADPSGTWFTNAPDGECDHGCPYKPGEGPASTVGEPPKPPRVVGRANCPDGAGHCNGVASRLPQPPFPCHEVYVSNPPRVQCNFPSPFGGKNPHAAWVNQIRADQDAENRRREAERQAQEKARQEAEEAARKADSTHMTCYSLTLQLIVQFGIKSCTAADGNGNNRQTFTSWRVGAGLGAGINYSASNDVANTPPSGVPGPSMYMDNSVEIGGGADVGLSRNIGSPGKSLGVGRSWGAGGSVATFGYESTSVGVIPDHIPEPTFEELQGVINY